MDLIFYRLKYFLYCFIPIIYAVSIKSIPIRSKYIILDHEVIIPGFIFYGIFIFFITFMFFKKSLLRKYFYRAKKLKSTYIIWLILIMYFLVGLILYNNSSPLVKMVATAIIWSPIIEEMLTRVFIAMHSFNNAKSFYLFIFLNSASFSLMHFIYEGIDINIMYLLSFDFFSKFLSHFIFGITLCIIADYYKRIEMVIIFHSMSNLSYILSLC